MLYSALSQELGLLPSAIKALPEYHPTLLPVKRRGGTGFPESLHPQATPIINSSQPYHYSLASLGLYDAALCMLGSVPRQGSTARSLQAVL